MTQTFMSKPEISWRVWVLPGADAWKLATGPEMKGNRDARKVTLDMARYERLVVGQLSVSEPLDAEREELETAA